MSTKEIKALTRRLFEEFNKGKAAAMAIMDELCATNIVYHGAGGEETRGLKDYKQHESEIFSAFPDLHMTIDDIVAEGDKVATRFTMTATHKGEYKGVAPTNKKGTLEAISIDRIVAGKFVEEWTKYDTLGLMQQLGVVPIPKKEK